MGLRLQGFIFTMGRVSGPTYWKYLSYYIPPWSWTRRQQIRNIFSQRKRKQCFLYYSTESQTLTGVSSMCEMVSPYGKEMLFFTTWPHADLHPLNMTDTICVTAAPSCHCQSLNVLMSSSDNRNTPYIFSDRVISRTAFLLFMSSESCHRQCRQLWNGKAWVHMLARPLTSPLPCYLHRRRRPQESPLSHKSA